MQQWHGPFENKQETLVLIERVSKLAGPRIYDAARLQLPRFRQEKADSLMLERDRQLSVGAWLLLDQAFQMKGLFLSDYSIGYSRQGKPYALDCPLHFNISHSGAYAMCTVSRAGEVGCDIQQIEPYDAGLARTCMMPCELKEIEEMPSSSQRADAFFRHWVAKESYIKALGCGLAKAPATFAVELCGDRAPGSPGRIRILGDTPTIGAAARETDAPEGYRAAVCLTDYPG